MLNDYMGILSLNEKEDNIKSLTGHRPISSIPIAGRYRIIDFSLSNLVNAGVTNVAIFTQSRSRSLFDHIGGGGPWDLDRKRDGIFVFNFGMPDPYINDIEMFKNNIDYFYTSRQKNVILSSSYMICNLDYKEAVKFHEKKGSDITVIYKNIDNGTSSFLGCDVLNINNSKRVISVGKNIGKENNHKLCMEMFIMKKEIFINMVYNCISSGRCRRIKDAIYASTSKLKIYAYEFKGYVECINSTRAYYKANMDMLNLKLTQELFFNNGVIYTKGKDEPATKYSKDAIIKNSLIANGCLINGTVINSVINRRVKIAKGAVVKNCVIMQNSEIDENAILTNIITDKKVTIGKNKILTGDREIPLVIEKEKIY